MFAAPHETANCEGSTRSIARAILAAGQLAKRRSAHQTAMWVATQDLPRIAAHSFALREFLGLVLPETAPDHATISRAGRLIDLETQQAIFTWILEQLAAGGLVKARRSE